MDHNLGKRFMFKAILGFLSSLLPFVSSHATCPHLAAKETQADCPWAEISRATQGLDPKKDAKKIKTIFNQNAPGFLKQFDHDLETESLFTFWGLSRNADESNLNEFIVPPHLLSYFAHQLKLTPYDPTFKFGNAGLNHTYGYVLSNLQTPYGYKRARYVKNEIETGFGLPPGMFNPLPQKGSLLSNLTYFTGNISIHDAISKANFHGVPEELKKFDYKKVKGYRLIETVVVGKIKLEVRTDIIPFFNTPKDPNADAALLIYSIDEGQGPKLITAFPVQSSFGAGIFKPDQLGDRQEIKIKYNGWISSMVPTTWTGKREKVDLQ